jgi:hypothetical protein
MGQHAALHFLTLARKKQHSFNSFRSRQFFIGPRMTNDKSISNPADLFCVFFGKTNIDEKVLSNFYDLSCLIASH